VLILIDRQPELIALELHGFAVAGVKFPALRAETMRALHSLRLPVYNLSGVIANEKCTRCFVNVTALNMAHAVPLSEE